MNTKRMNTLGISRHTAEMSGWGSCGYIAQVNMALGVYGVSIFLYLGS